MSADGGGDVTGKKLESYQDLRLRGNAAGLARIRAEILSVVMPPWSHDATRETDMRESTGKNDVLVLMREAFAGIDESSLFLWENDGGYEVTNIVPRNVSELGVSKYNAILDDFVKRVASPAERKGSFTIEQTAALQTIDDWLDADSVEALRRFSNLANKSTGASHPLDQQRWFAFLAKAHRARSSLDTSQLSRWLTQSESWPEDTALELALEYEFGRALLKWYDSSRS